MAKRRQTSGLQGNDSFAPAVKGNFYRLSCVRCRLDNHPLLERGVHAPPLNSRGGT